VLRRRLETSSKAGWDSLNIITGYACCNVERFRPIFRNGG
jgi:hypothetical protein